MNTNAKLGLLIVGLLIVVGILYRDRLNVSPNPAPSPSPAVQPPVVQSPTPSPTPTTPTPPPTTPPQAQTPKEIVSGDTSKKQVIFTFDGGAGSHSAEKILDVTAKHNVKTTFFLTGKFGDTYPDITKKIAAAGHEIYNHTYNHPYLTQISDEQIIKEFSETENVLSHLTGKTTKPYFRPPYGSRTAHVLEVAGNEGYQSVYWSTDALDWKEGITETEVKKRIMDNLKPGSLYLMHIGDDITGNILDEVFTEIENQGYTIVSLTEGIK
jgi:peptidoglycan-N-acetylglucosamine deacetylase